MPLRCYRRNPKQIMTWKGNRRCSPYVASQCTYDAAWISECAALLEDIVASNEYSLAPDYADIFDPTNKNNSESIFEIQYRQGTDGYSSSFTYSFLPYPLEKDTVAN